MSTAAKMYAPNLDQIADGLCRRGARVDGVRSGAGDGDATGVLDVKADRPRRLARGRAHAAQLRLERPRSAVHPRGRRGDDRGHNKGVFSNGEEKINEQISYGT